MIKWRECKCQQMLFMSHFLLILSYESLILFPTEKGIFIIASLSLSKHYFTSSFVIYACDKEMNLEIFEFWNGFDHNVYNFGSSFSSTFKITFILLYYLFILDFIIYILYKFLKVFYQNCNHLAENIIL